MSKFMNAILPEGRLLRKDTYRPVVGVPAHRLLISVLRAYMLKG